MERRPGISAPGAGSGSGTSARLPAVDERLAPPETRVEYIGGAEYFAAPADEPHATRHAQIAAVLRVATSDRYETAVDLLTRTDEASDFAPDVSVFQKELDPTGHRKLEDLSFEITNEQSIGVPTRKARELTARGVRRVFCILVKQNRVLEWSREADTWRTLLESDRIEDVALVEPIPVRALLDAGAADELTARALLAKHHPIVEAARAADRADGELRGEARGEVQGRRAALHALLAARGFEAAPDVAARIAACADARELDTWIARAAVASALTTVFDEATPR